MRKVLFLLLIGLMLLPGWAAATLAAPPLQAAAGAPRILTFTTTATGVDPAALANRTARVPVAWTTANRPNTANLVFEQVLPDSRVVNVELPRSDPFVASNGIGVVAPFPPGGNATTIELRVRLIDLVTQNTLDTRTLTVPITTQTGPTPTIAAFTAGATSVNINAINARTARIPVSWTVDNRPQNSNLVFEQVLADNSAVNVELPRENPFVASSGNGVVAPVAPGANATEVKLRLRLINLSDASTIVQREISVALDTSALPVPTIKTFTAAVTNVSRTQLSTRTARIPVSWEVTNRPDNSNLAFEQILDDGRIINVELPRANPFVASAGNGVVAPVPPGGAGTQIKLRLRLFDTRTQNVFATSEITVGIAETASPAITSFATTAAGVERASLVNRTARIPVSWEVLNRPNNGNLVFEQVLDNNLVVNVELPRANPFVASAGTGVVAPIAPTAATVTSIRLRLRVVDVTNPNTTFAEREITVPITEGPPPGSFIRSFTTTAVSVDGAALTARTARVPVAWEVVNRPQNSNLVFEQVLPNGSSVNVELPRTVPLVPSAGLGVAAPVAPGTGVAEIVLRVRLINLANGATFDQRDIKVPIAGVSVTPTAQPTTAPTTPPTITAFTASPDPVARGGVITLAWTVSGASRVAISLQSLAGLGQEEEVKSAAPLSSTTGTITYTLPPQYVNDATFMLSAFNDAGQETAQSVTVTVTCPFNTSLLADTCPVTQQTVQAAFQPFERGFMVWRGDLKKIYVLLNDGTWSDYDDTFVAGETLPDPGTPPTGLLAPQSGFGKVWSQHNGATSLGWATAAEQAYSAVWETHLLLDGGGFAEVPSFKLPDGRTAHLGLTWRFE